MDAVISWARGEIDSELHQWYLKRPKGLPYPAPPELVRAKHTTLYSMWLSGRYVRAIKSILKKTKSAALKSLLADVTRHLPIA
jgi:hypothetical protein